jgi:hypothetical protein
MSKLLIQRSGKASSNLTQNGAGGLVIAPDAHLHVMKFDFLQGVTTPQVVTDGTGTATLKVNVIKSLAAGGGQLYVTNNQQQDLALGGKLLAANGVNVNSDDSTDDGYIFGPWFSDGTVTIPKRSGENMFVAGVSSAFYCKAVIRVGDVEKLRDIAIGFAKCETSPATPVSWDELYAGGFNDDTLDDGSILEHLATGDTDAYADTGLNAVNDTDIEIEVRVSAAGVCSLFAQGQDVTQTGKTFTKGEEVQPIIHILADGGAATHFLRSFEWGPQAARK